MKTIPTKVTIVDLHTGKKTIEDSGLKLLPVSSPTACPECGRDPAHAPEEPHDAQSLHYQYSFYADHGRWPTWKDALAHCPPAMRQAWEDELRRLGAWWTEPADDRAN